MKKLLNKKILIITAVVLFSLIIFVIFQSKKESQEAIIPPNIDKSISYDKPQEFSIDFSQVNFTPPQSINLYSIKQQTLDELIQLLAQKYNLLPHPLSGKIWQNQDKTISIISNFEDNTVELNFPQPNFEMDKKPLSKEKSIKAVKALVQQIIFSELSIDEDNIVYLDNSPEPQPVSNINQAKNILIPFQITINNLPIYFGDNPQTALTAYVSTNHIITKLIIHPQILIQEKVSSPKIVHINSISKYIQSGDAIITQYIDNQTRLSMPIIKLPQNIAATSIDLEYRFTSQSNIAIPYYHLEANAIIGGNPTTISISTPAIEYNQTNN